MARFNEEKMVQRDARADTKELNRAVKDVEKAHKAVEKGNKHVHKSLNAYEKAMRKEEKLAVEVNKIQNRHAEAVTKTKAIEAEMERRQQETSFLHHQTGFAKGHLDEVRGRLEKNHAQRDVRLNELAAAKNARAWEGYGLSPETRSVNDALGTTPDGGRIVEQVIEEPNGVIIDKKARGSKGFKVNRSQGQRGGQPPAQDDFAAMPRVEELRETRNADGVRTEKVERALRHDNFEPTLVNPAQLRAGATGGGGGGGGGTLSPLMTGDGQRVRTSGEETRTVGETTTQNGLPAEFETTTYTYRRDVL